MEKDKKEHHKKYMHEWSKKNKEKVKIASKKSYNKHKKSRLERLKKEKDIIRFDGNRENALERDNWQCQMCGMNQEQHLLLFGRGLNVHHKDDNGKKGKIRNNNLYNLQTLCVRCHGSTQLNLYKRR